MGQIKIKNQDMTILESPYYEPNLKTVTRCREDEEDYMASIGLPEYSSPFAGFMKGGVP